MASELAPVAASNSELRSIPLEDDGDELDPSNEARSDTTGLRNFTHCETSLKTNCEENDGGMHLSRHRRKNLLQKLQYRLRSLVRLLQRGNAGLLQSGVLCHVGHRLPISASLMPLSALVRFVTSFS